MQVNVKKRDNQCGKMRTQSVTGQLTLNGSQTSRHAGKDQMQGKTQPQMRVLRGKGQETRGQVQNATINERQSNRKKVAKEQKKDHTAKKNAKLNAQIASRWVVHPNGLMTVQRNASHTTQTQKKYATLRASTVRASASEAAPLGPMLL